MTLLDIEMGLAMLLIVLGATGFILMSLGMIGGLIVAACAMWDDMRRR